MLEERWGVLTHFFYFLMLVLYVVVTVIIKLKENKSNQKEETLKGNVKKSNARKRNS